MPSGRSWCKDAMDILATIAERKIQEAMARGAFADLPGKGKPLPREDLSGVPEELRMAYKILKNAGFVPPEVELHKEIVTLRNLLVAMEHSPEREKRLKELNYKLLRFNILRRLPLALDELPEYRERLMDRLAG